MLGITELSPEDRLFWEIAARYPARPMICTFYFELSGAPARSHLQALVDAACAAHPRLTWRLETERGQPRWRSHGPPAVTWSVDPELRSHGERCARLAAQSGSPLPESGPSWSLGVLSERPENAPAGGTYGLLLRWHHALSDAEGVLDLLVAMARTAPGRPLADPEFNRGRVGGGAPSPRPARPGLAALRQRLRSGGARSSSPGGSRVEVCSPALRLDFAGAEAIAGALDVTVEDVLNVLSARAIARVCGSASLLAPTSARPPKHRVRIGNLVRTLRLAHDPRGLSLEASLRAVAVERARVLTEPSPVASWLRRAVLRMPQPVIDRVFATMPPFFSNFRRWSEERLELGGPALLRLHAIPPLLPYHGATMAFVSYAGELHCDLTTDPSLRSDAARLKEAIEASDAELCDLAAAIRHDDALSGAATTGA